MKVEKERVSKQLEEQLKALERNFTYFNLKLMKYHTTDLPETVCVENAKNEILDVLEKMKNGYKFQQLMKNTIEDIEDLVVYSKFKSDENKMKGVV